MFPVRHYETRRSTYGACGALIIGIFLVAASPLQSTSPSSSKTIRDTGGVPTKKDRSDFSNNFGTADHPLIVGGHLTMEETRYVSDDQRRDRAEAASREKLILTWTALSAVSTMLLFLVALAQAGFFWWQLRLIRDGADVAKVAAAAAKSQAKAAKRAADASLAALDRPWPVLESVEHNKVAWIGEAESLLYAQFVVTNYGNAPAFISSIRAVLFQSMWPSTKVALQGAILPADYVDVPDKDAYSDFIGSAGSHLSDSKATWRPMLFDTPAVIARNASSQILYCRCLPIRRAVRVDVNAQLVLAGQITYCGPDEQSWILNFFYLGGGDGRFQRFGGPPYNLKRRGNLLSTPWIE